MTVINVTTGADLSRTGGQQFSWPHTPLVACLQQVWSWENVKRHHVGQVSLGGEGRGGGKSVGFTGCHSARLRQTVQHCTSGVLYFFVLPRGQTHAGPINLRIRPTLSLACVWCFPPPFSLHWEYWESHCETSKQLMSLWGEGERLQWRWTPDKSGRINHDLKLTLNLPDRQEGGICDTSAGTEALCAFETFWDNSFSQITMTTESVLKWCNPLARVKPFEFGHYYITEVQINFHQLWYWTYCYIQSCKSTNLSSNRRLDICLCTRRVHTVVTVYLSIH